MVRKTYISLTGQFYLLSSIKSCVIALWAGMMVYLLLQTSFTREFVLGHHGVNQRKLTIPHITQNRSEQERFAQELDKESRKDLQDREVRRYGTQAVSLISQHWHSQIFILQKPIRFLDNYKNPCWYNSTAGDIAAAPVLHCLPYVLVPGIQKCGSTTLFHTLRLHHQLEPAVVKEFHQFMSGREYSGFFRPAASYIQGNVTYTGPDRSTWFHPLVTYDSTPTNLITLADPSYWEHHYPHEDIAPFTKAYLVKKFIPNAKVIITMRNPTDRTYSDYNHFLHLSPNHFHQLVTVAIRKWIACRETPHSRRYCAYHATAIERKAIPLGMSMYDVFIEDWIKVLGRENFFFMQLEEFQADPVAMLTRIFHFLDLEPMKPKMLQEIKDEKHHRVNQREYAQPMWNKTRTLLDNFYKPHLKHLTALLGDEKWMWGK